jgi:hypothetical protein
MENGFLKNVRRLNLFKLWRRTSLIDLNGTMNHLEELSIDRAVKTAEDFTRVFTSCPKLTRLSIKLSLDPLVYGSLRTNKLRSGFQRLKYLKLSASTLPTFGIILP